MLSSHMTPVQIDEAITMTDEALANQSQLNKKITDIIADASGSFALIAHASYLFERTQDVKTIIVRMKQNQRLLVELAQKDTLLRPKKRIYRKKLSQPLQKVYEKSQEVHQQMKLDMEALYIFGNLLLDQWAHVVGYIVNDLEPQKWNFATFVDKVQKKGDKGILEPLWLKHHHDILWLHFQLRMYRNVFIEHMRVPRQRGTHRMTQGHDFKLFSPTPSNALDDDQIKQKVKSILHLAPYPLNQQSSGTFSNSNMRNVLETIFYNIDQIAEQVDREKVWNVWNEVGGLTPSYDVIAARLMRFVVTSILTLIDMISMHPEIVNSGRYPRILAP